MSIHEAEITFTPLAAMDCFSKDDMVDRFMCIMADCGIYNACGDIEERQELYSALTSDEYSVEFIKEMESVLSGNDKNIALGVVNQMRRQEPEKIIRGALHFYPLSGIKDYADFDSLFSGVARYDSIVDCPDYTTAHELTQRQIVGMLKAIKTLEMESDIDRDSLLHPVVRINSRALGTTMRIFRDNDIHFLVLERPEQAEEIARVAARYKINDRNSILAIMDGIMPAVASGAL